MFSTDAAYAAADVFTNEPLDNNNRMKSPYYRGDSVAADADYRHSHTDINNRHRFIINTNKYEG